MKKNYLLLAFLGITATQFASAADCTYRLRSAGANHYIVDMIHIRQGDVRHSQLEDGTDRYTIHCDSPMDLPAGSNYKIQLRYTFGFDEAFRTAYIQSSNILGYSPKGGQARTVIDGNPVPASDAPGALVTVPAGTSPAFIRFSAPYPEEYLWRRPLQIFFSGGFVISQLSVDIR